MRRATLFSKKYRCSKNRFQSTLSVRRATRAVGGGFKINLRISIHALREESDIVFIIFIRFINLFQSTLSVRRATLKIVLSSSHLDTFQSTLSVRRATKLYHLLTAIRHISIHALREESDLLLLYHLLYLFLLFQSTLSVRRATVRGLLATSKSIYFNPRSP